MAVAIQTPADVASEYAALQFVISQILGRVQTAALVRVLAVTNDGGASAAGSVDVQPLVNQMTGDRQAVPHGTLHKVPYLRIQGGANAVIMDPQVGDIGVCVFCSRDISAVKTAKGPANPGSFRTFDFADGLYLGGFLNGVPTQYVQFNTDGITLVSPTRVTIQAPDIVLDGPVTATSTIDAATEVTANGTPLHTHRHVGVTTGGGTSGLPTP